MINDGKLIEQVYQENIISSSIDGCNILKIYFPLNDGKNICVIGCRLETGGEKDLKKQYDSELRNFDGILMPYCQKVDSDDYCIVCGDFNNGRCLGNLNKKYDSKDYYRKAQINYNLNLIKDKFSDLGYAMADNINGEPIPTHKNFFPDDHIFTKRFCIKKCEPISVDQLSDHDILIAECDWD